MTATGLEEQPQIKCVKYALTLARILHSQNMTWSFHKFLPNYFVQIQILTNTGRSCTNYLQSVESQTKLSQHLQKRTIKQCFLTLGKFGIWSFEYKSGLKQHTVLESYKYPLSGECHTHLTITNRMTPELKAQLCSIWQVHIKVRKPCFGP